jgi:hypothetical protein
LGLQPNTLHPTPSEPQHFNNYNYITKNQFGLQNADFNENITRKLDIKKKKINLKFDFDSSPTCYNLEHKSIYESVTFKMTHFVFVNKGQILCVIILILTLIDKCKMCHFECHGLIFLSIVNKILHSVQKSSQKIISKINQKRVDVVFLYLYLLLASDWF